MTACGWVGWCTREGEYVVELSNRAGTERMIVCRLHLAPAQLYGYRVVGPGEGEPATTPGESRQPPSSRAATAATAAAASVPATDAWRPRQPR